MANLKDIRTRINSVKTTRQVTSAMKMVSAAKFKKAHDDVAHITPFVEKLSNIIYDLVNSCMCAGGEVNTPYTKKRAPENILIVAIASNRGLCGAFNSNIVKKVETLLESDFASQYKNKSVDIITIGKQPQKVLKQRGFNIINDYNDFWDNPTFDAAAELAGSFMDAFSKNKYDRVIVVYNEFVNAVSQIVRAEQLLPLEMPVDNDVKHSFNYIYEPDVDSIINTIIPKALKILFYKMLLDSLASEHGARMTSMHKATDNATELLGDLELEYNKARQSAITKEILEIVSGAEALKS
ncbi:MAG: ATP synthase F1 subunit gamma [Chlorobi bacterium]|nr:ATP synthase F1 subunit gamma [Chlorobiota bacterium]